MAVTRGLRTTVYRWSDSLLDAFTRDQMDASHAAIEDLMAIDAQGTLAARPAAAIRGRYYAVVDPGGPSDGMLYRDTGSAWRTITNPPVTLRLGHTFAVSGDVLVASGDNFYIPPMFVTSKPGQTTRIVGVRYVIRSGTSATFDLRLNDLAIDLALNGLVATPVPKTTLFTTGALADEAALAPVITAVAGTPRNMTITVLFEYTAT